MGVGAEEYDDAADGCSCIRGVLDSSIIAAAAARAPAADGCSLIPWSPSDAPRVLWLVLAGGRSCRCGGDLGSRLAATAALDSVSGLVWPLPWASVMVGGVGPTIVAGTASGLVGPTAVLACGGGGLWSESSGGIVSLAKGRSCVCGIPDRVWSLMGCASSVGSAGTPSWVSGLGWVRSAAMAAAAETGAGVGCGGEAPLPVVAWAPDGAGCGSSRAHCSRSMRPVGRRVPNCGSMGSDMVRRIASPGRSMDRVDDESLEGTDM